MESLQDRFMKKVTGRYQSVIAFDGKQTYLGRFPTPQLAHEAYCQAAIKLHGGFVNTGDK